VTHSRGGLFTLEWTHPVIYLTLFISHYNGQELS